MFDVHLVVYADENFAEKYATQIRSLRCFSQYWHYKFHVLPVTTDKTSCANMRGEVFFARHCLFAEWLAVNTLPNDVAVLLDADVAAAGLRPSLEYYVADLLLNSGGEAVPSDVMFFERIWGVAQRNEIMAGTYMVRNTAKARRFLRQWAEFMFRKPPGFSSADNGAIHLALAEATALGPKEKTAACAERYEGLTALVDDLDPYFEFVGCVRELMHIGNTEPSVEGQAFERAKAITLSTQGNWTQTATRLDTVIPGLRAKILAHDEAWAADWWARKNEHSPLGHGVKNAAEARKQKWFNWKDVNTCEDFDGTKASDVNPEVERMTKTDYTKRRTLPWNNLVQPISERPSHFRGGTSPRLLALDVYSYVMRGTIGSTATGRSAMLLLALLGVIAIIFMLFWVVLFGRTWRARERRRRRTTTLVVGSLQSKENRKKSKMTNYAALDNGIEGAGLDVIDEDGNDSASEWQRASSIS